MRVFMLMTAFVAAVGVSAAFETAEARRGSGGGGHSSRSFSGSHFSGSHFHAPRTYYRAAPRYYQRSYIYSGPRYVTDRCAWLRHRALATGSRIWWQRYSACRAGVYY